MKKIKSLRLASILLIGTLLSMCLLGGTFAKYTTSGSGKSESTVARWSISANGRDIAVSPSATVAFCLFDTAYDTATGSEADADTKAKTVAPGTAGRYKLKIANDSDVSAKYTITLTEDNGKNLPIQYSLDGETWVDSLAEISTEGLTDQTILYTDEVKYKEHTVYWRWVFDAAEGGAHDGQSDSSDSTFGANAEATTPDKITVTATITASQID